MLPYALCSSVQKPGGFRDTDDLTRKSINWQTENYVIISVSGWMGNVSMGTLRSINRHKFGETYSASVIYELTYTKENCDTNNLFNTKPKGFYFNNYDVFCYHKYDHNELSWCIRTSSHFARKWFYHAEWTKPHNNHHITTVTFFSLAIFHAFDK